MFCKHCMLTTIKVYVCCAVIIYKKQTQQIFKQGGARPVCWSLIRLCEIGNYFILFPILLYDLWLAKGTLKIIINYTI